jgi:voltage-gated potassium channel
MPEASEFVLLMDHGHLFSVRSDRLQSLKGKQAGDGAVHLSAWLRESRRLVRSESPTEFPSPPDTARRDVRVKLRGAEPLLSCDFLLGKYRGDGAATPFGTATSLESLLDAPTPGGGQREAILSLVQAQMENQMRRATIAERKESSSAERARSFRRIQNRLETITSSVGFRIGIFLVVLITISMFGIMLFEPGANEQFESIWDSFWYSVVTVTTVGYGDKSPITTGGKLVGLVLMGLGVVVLAAITGQIASFFVELQLRRREGLVSLKNVKNHFIICGWRRELEKVLDGILSVNPGIDVSDLVLVNHVDKEQLQPIFNNPRYAKIKYLNGDFIQSDVLQKASIETASRVMVLADFSADYSMQEVDSRTVMTVLTIESLNRQVYVVAELLDPKFEKFLKLANCDEIILSREYSKLIIANASSASGVSHVIGDLLSTDDGQGLRSRDIPVEFYGRNFGDLFDHLNQQYGDITIGLLENTGNFYQRKREALSEAQMTPDISRLVENLKTVKQLVPNNSVLNPGRDYQIKSHSRAIVVEARFYETAEV